MENNEIVTLLIHSHCMHRASNDKIASFTHLYTLLYNHHDVPSAGLCNQVLAVFSLGETERIERMVWTSGG